ncbi:MAG: lysophospholipid acyltransferase family protein [Planctomycetes bacterium]|nr:lysophospholipid acyltransferase family protein [Planctomycetota bacterium]
MRIQSPFLTKVVGFVAAMIFRTLSRTLRFHGYAETEGTDPSVALSTGHIFSLWHDSIMIPLARQSMARTKVAALVSRHRDGGYLAEFMHVNGIRSVRGSSARGGDQALRELMRVEDEYQIFITPDGPRGPHHEIKSGLIYLASRTGRPILPVASYFGNAWHIEGSWTGQYIPKPFSENWYLIGAPISIPPDQTREQIEQHRQYVQAEMDRLEQKLLRIKRGEEPAGESLRRAA